MFFITDFLTSLQEFIATQEEFILSAFNFTPQVKMTSQFGLIMWYRVRKRDFLLQLFHQLQSQEVPLLLEALWDAYLIAAAGRRLNYQSSTWSCI